MLEMKHGRPYRGNGVNLEERRASLVEIISGLGRTKTQLKQKIIIITHDAEIFENAEVDAVYRFEASPEGTQVKIEP